MRELTSNPMVFPCRLCIHIPIRGSAFWDCLAANRILSMPISGPISFESASEHIPHITLFTCTAIDALQLKSILEGTAEMVRGLSPVDFHFSAPYAVSDYKGIWYFIDAMPAAYLRSLRLAMKKQLSSIGETYGRDVTQDRPHVTLAYVLGARARDSMLREISIGSFCCTALEVSKSGPKGTCIGTIQSFEIAPAFDQRRTG